MGVGAGLCMYDVVVKNSRSLSHLLMSFLYINSFNLNVGIHCFCTMLKVEGLEKRLGLARSRSKNSVSVS